MVFILENKFYGKDWYLSNGCITVSSLLWAVGLASHKDRKQWNTAVRPPYEHRKRSDQTNVMGCSNLSIFIKGETPVMYVTVLTALLEGHWIGVFLVLLYSPLLTPSTLSFKAVQTFSTALNYRGELYTVIRARWNRGTSREQDDLTQNRSEWSGKWNTAAWQQTLGYKLH